MGEYNTTCPCCGGGVYLVQYTGITNSPVMEDGWDLGAESTDTQDEIFRCGDCGRYVPDDWVFKRISEDEAKKLMPEQEEDN